MQKNEKKVIRSLFTFLLAIALLFPLTPLVGAVPAFPDTSGAVSVYLWNKEHDKVIFSKSEEEIIYPASLTKIMTGIVAIELIGNRLDESLTLTSDMFPNKSGTSMQLSVGEVLTYKDLLYGTLCGGFNDAANALAVASAGSLSAFVEKMNEKAVSLGAKNTHYTNPTGWHDEAMVTTLSDMAIIAKEAANDPLYLEISSASSYKMPETNKSKSFNMHNRNGLISSFYVLDCTNKRAKGLIAGMTDEGGHCLATTFEYDGLSYVCIVMGATEIDGKIMSYDIANKIISHTINYYGELNVISAGDTVTKTPVSLAISNTDDEYYMLKCTVETDVSVFTPYDNDSLKNIELRPYFFSDKLSAPIKKGEVLGGVDIFVDGNLRGTTALVSSSDVEANTFLSFMTNAKKMLASRTFIVFFITFAILFTVYFLNFEIKAMRKKNKKIKIDRIY